MIPKAERDVDKAICEAATPEWQQGHHVGEPKALCSKAAPLDSLLMLDKDGMAIFWHEVDAKAAVTARNRLPLYIADAEEMERRIAAVKTRAQEYAASEERADRQHGAGMREALKILRGKE